MADIITGWEPGRRTHFDDIVVNYDNVRPSYPPELFAELFEYAGADSRKALEIGAGTGKATLPVLEAGYDVTAIEIGANMAEFLRERFAEYKSFNVTVSAFEDAALEDDSCDLVYAASAFHWVNAEIGCPKAFRILKNGGVIALFRYNILHTGGGALADEIERVHEEHYGSYYTGGKPPVITSEKDLATPSENMRNFGFENLADYGFRDVEQKFFRVTRYFGADEYIAWLDTMSDHRALPAANRTALYDGIKAAIIKYGGVYSMEFIFQLYLGRK